MAALPYIQLYVADYLADTAHLTAAEHGAYLLLIFNYWQRGKPLNNFNERLTNVARMSSEEWESAKPVLSEFFDIQGDEWVHPRIEADLQAVLDKSTKASNAGKASAIKKSNGRSTDVKRTLNHTDTDTDTDTDKTKATSKTKATASRLLSDWTLPKSWGDWALTEKPSWKPSDVRQCADTFRDYWVAVAGAKGRKLDWEATWRNWVRRQEITKSKGNIHERRAETIAILTGRDRQADNGRTIEGSASTVDRPNF